MDIKLNLKHELEAILPLTNGVEKVKEYLSTDLALKDAEKLVYNDAALAIGDMYSDKNVFSKGYDKNIYRISILLFIKSLSGETNASENIRIIKEGLRNNPLNSSTVVTSQIENVSERRNLTDRISYFTIEYKVLQYEPVGSDPVLAADDFLRSAKGLIPGNVLTAIGDSSFEFLPPDTEQIINAKGDLIVGDADANPTRLPIGDPNYFLVVDPTQDRGYKFSNELDGGTF